jgi:hypothetical protein
VELISGSRVIQPRNNEVRTLDLIKEVLAIKGKRTRAIATITGGLALVGSAISQDKYTLTVPNGLSFLEFKDTRPGRLSPLVMTEIL